MLNQYWVLTAYTVTDQDHDDGYLRQTKNESWVWITTNGCNQLCKYEWLIIRQWLVGWIRPLRKGHSFSLFQIKEKQTDRAEVLTVTEQDCKTIDEFASSQLAPSDPRLSRPETRVDGSISRTVMCVTWMNEWMRETRRSRGGLHALYTHCLRRRGEDACIHLEASKGYIFWRVTRHEGPGRPRRNVSWVLLL